MIARRVLMFPGLIALLMLAALGPALANDAVTVQLDWVVRGDHGIFFVGRDKGFFAAQGIDVTAIRRGTGSVVTMRMVGAGQADFGFGDLPTAAVARSQDVPVVALAAVNQTSPLAFISLAAKHPLRRPADLEGLTVGVQPAGSTYVFFRAFAAANRLDLAKIAQLTVAPPYENYLLLGRVDAVPGYIDAEVPDLAAKAGGPKALDILLGSDYGYTMLGSGLVTSAAMIQGKPDLVQRFVRAYLAAFDYVVAHPEETADIIIRANPEYQGKRDVLIQQLRADIDHTFAGPATREHGLGWMDAGAWTKTVAILQEQAVITRPLDPAAVYDNRFVAAARK